jgi:hypothetical protein
LAGGGIAGGAIYGKSDARAMYPAADPVTPQDYAATLMHALGVPHAQAIGGPDGRPHPVYGGRPIRALFS